MLWLKRNTNTYQLEKCDVSGELIYPGDYYYQDDVDYIKIKATVYANIKKKEKENNWDYSKINNAHNEYEYRQAIKDATRQMLYDSVLNRKIATKLNNDIDDETLDILYRYKEGEN